MKNRYVRHTSLQGFGPEKQQLLQQAKVLVIGAGGLGIPVLQYLNAMGIGALGIVDDDIVDISNLQRQVLYDETSIGQPKVQVLLHKLKAQNSETTIAVFQERLTISNAEKLIEKYDVIVDATDNFETRYLVNDICVLLKKPLVYGALHAFEGQVSVFNYQNGPTYRCLFPKPPKATEIPDCNVNGVLGIIPSIIGSFQALEVVKIITGVGEVLSGKLMLYDGLTQRIQQIGFEKNTANETVDLSRYHQEKAITASALMALIKEKKIKVLDVRTEDEVNLQPLEVQHITVSNIPLATILAATFHIDFPKKTYVLCQSGIRSQKAIAHLQTLFPTQQFINIQGGFQALQPLLKDTIS